jgi:hypothetical protein
LGSGCIPVQPAHDAVAGTGADKYAGIHQRMAAMETQQLNDELSDDDRVTAYRTHLKGKLDAIAAEAKQRLADVDLDIPLFFVLPNSGSSIVNFGTVRDPDDETWQRTREIVAAIIEASVGIPRVRCREMHCATTDDQAQQDAPF